MVQTRSMRLNKEIPTKKQEEIFNFIKIQLVQFENNKTKDDNVLTCFIIFDYNHTNF